MLAVTTSGRDCIGPARPPPPSPPMSLAGVAALGTLVRMELSPEDIAEIARQVAAQLGAQRTEAPDAAEQVAVIEASADAQVAVIEAQADAEVAVMEAAADITEQLDTANSDGDGAEVGSDDAAEVADTLDITDDERPEPKATHPYFRPLGRS
jgi:hypothetical protein